MYTSYIFVTIVEYQIVMTKLKMKKNAPSASECPFRATLELLEGKWKFAIIYSLLKKGTLRFKELEREVGGITSRMLVVALKDLESNGIVLRQAYATVPPTVEYSLTECGLTLEPIVRSIRAWGEDHLHQAVRRIGSPA